MQIYYAIANQRVSPPGRAGQDRGGVRDKA